MLVCRATVGPSAYRELMEPATWSTPHTVFSSPAHATRQGQALIYAVIQREDSVKSFIDDFWLLGVIFLAMIPSCLL